ncbi:hypothetical protein HDA32_004389 [Spinactinospora alkalitolerans]|uniref:DUF742 domain-containing protein n=1 Tax=Spinactinospora alkalitolerans TaxID=687207 RepID=A0A852TZ52_9ACTN|nr:DUF742 domain-containing protein [Spinactinospora alkalitolerans]NYE49269.1 hypothetical protein [Spinactinospora alkalitolerans]
MSKRRRRGARIRPYTFTGGRTRSRHPLMVQTLVSTADPGTEPPKNLMPESQDIHRLCREARSVAEIAAQLKIPLGVTQVLLSDLADQDLIYIHPTITGHSPSENQVLERALRGLERLFQ